MDREFQLMLTTNSVKRIKTDVWFTYELDVIKGPNIHYEVGIRNYQVSTGYITTLREFNEKFSQDFYDFVLTYTEFFSEDDVDDSVNISFNLSNRIFERIASTIKDG